MKNTQSVRVRFGVFELDLRSGELRRGDDRILLQEQPLQILCMLVEREGEVVPREEIRKRLWPNDTIVDFDHSINAAIRNLRRVLGDSADESTYIETLARRGYRLMVGVEWLAVGGHGPAEVDAQGADGDGAASRPVLQAAALSGQVLSHYRVLDIIGGGGMGVVYRAEDLKLGRQVALKFLPEEMGRDPQALERFSREARAASSLDHPNICAIYEFGEHEGQPFIVMQLLEGQTLREYLGAVTAKHERLPLERLLEIATHIAGALESAHEKGIVHRDIKPANVFITSRGMVKILDFGLAQLQKRPEEDDVAAQQDPLPARSGNLHLTRTGIRIGTAGYMSPEQVRGEKLDARTDIFSLGLVLYEMATGQRAFSGETATVLHDAILNQDPPSFSQSGKNISPGLQRVILRCLEKKPEQRFQSASDLAFALETLSDFTSSPVAVPSHRPGKSRKWTVLSGVAVLIGVGLAVWWVRPVANPKIEVVKQLTYDGEPKNGNVETDGTRLYFNEGNAGSSRITQVSVNGGQTAIVPSDLDNASVVALSEDGSALLLLVGSFNGPPGALWSLPLPAGQARRLAETEATDASFFPDGRLLYTLGAGLYIAASDGSNSRKLLDLAHYVSAKPRVMPGDKRLVAFPKVSPDATKIVFNTLDANNQLGTIFQMASDGTNVNQLLKGELQNLPREICCAKWTPNGQYLVFQGKSEERWDLWAVHYGNRFLWGHAQPVQLTNGPLSYSLGSLSRDGKEIFVIGTQRRGELVRYDDKLREFVPYMRGVSILDPTFSRDGKWMAYRSYPDYTVWRSRADGSDPLQLTYAPTDAIFPQISPDGTRVAFSSPEGILYVVSVNGGTPQRLCDNAWGPAWSPDANRVAFTSVVSGKEFGEKGFYQTRVLDLRNGDISVIPDSDDTVGAYFVEGDGLVAAKTMHGNFKFMFFDLKKNEWSVLATTENGFVNWAPSLDGKYLFCTTAGNDPKALRIRISDHAVEPIASLKDLRRVDAPYVTTSANVAPDGSMLFTRDIGTQEIYALTVKWP